MTTTLEPNSKQNYMKESETLGKKNDQILELLKKSIHILGSILLWILRFLVTVYLAFFSYVAIHEILGHVLFDTLIFVAHGTTPRVFDVVIQFLDFKMVSGYWTVALVPFRIGGEVISAIPASLFTFSDGEVGFSLLMGSAITTLFSFISLIVLNIRKNLSRFPWFLCTFALSSVIFDQLIYTFGDPSDALKGAVLMGINPFLFKGIVIGLVLLQGWLLIRIAIRHLRSRKGLVEIRKQ